MDQRQGEPGRKAAPRGPSGAASPFVGREDELRRLTAALSLAAEGRGAIVFLTGQPGIGKTRLAREALALARARCFTVLEGRAYPLQTDLAYAPVLNAFGPLLRRLNPARLAALVDGLPDLGRLFGGLRRPLPSLCLEGLGNPALEKTRLFEAVSRLLERLTQEAPVALFVDDLHWTDHASLELLHYLARGLADQRTLLLATFNVEALNTSRSLRGMVRSLQRDGLAEEIVVPPLGQEAVEKLVRGIHSGEAPDDLLALLDARTRGTPLFVEALIAALIDSGNLVCSASGKGGWVLDAEGALALPESVRHLILERLERLAPAERRVLGLIAILGDATSHAILRAAGGLEEEPLLEALQGLETAGLVAEHMDGSAVAYGVTHPLVQEVAHAELPEMARRRAHLAAIEALESLSEGRPENVSRLARHYRGAGPEADPNRAVAVLLAAGERALSFYANEEAAQHFAAALALLRGGQGTGVGDQSPGPFPLPTGASGGSVGTRWQAGRRRRSVERSAGASIGKACQRGNGSICYGKNSRCRRPP